MSDDIFSQEKSWASELKKGKQDAGRWRTLGFEKEKLGLQEDMVDQKHFLMTAIYEKNHSNIKDVLKKMIEIRARQTIVALREMEERYGILDELLIESQIKKYVKDVAELAQAVENMQKI